MKINFSHPKSTKEENVSPNSFPYELPLQAEISSAQAKVFLEVIRSALIFPSSSDVANLHIHSDDKNAIVISFDGS